MLGEFFTPIFFISFISTWHFSFSESSFILVLFSFAFYLALLLFLCSVKSVFLHILPFLFKLARIRSQFLSFFFFSRNLFFLSDLFLSPLLILFPHVSNFPIYPHFFFSFVISFFLFPVLLFLLSTLREERFGNFFFFKLLSGKGTPSGPAS